MWQINPISNKFYNCFHYCTAALADLYKCDYKMVMLELWGFRYDSISTNTIGQNLELCWNDETERRKELLSKYHGLHFNIWQRLNEAAETFIDEKLKVSPVVIYLDAYDCHWLPFYKKLHCEHTLILAGKESNNYIFYDQYLENIDKNLIACSFIAANYKKIVNFHYEGKPVISKGDYINEIKRSTAIFKSRRTLEQYQCFVNAMRLDFDINREIIGKDPLASELIMNLKYIGEDRLNLIEGLEYIEQNTGISFSLCKDKLLLISQLYEKLRAYIMKCSFVNRTPNAQKISEEVQKIYASELEVLACLEEL